MLDVQQAYHINFESLTKNNPVERNVDKFKILILLKIILTSFDKLNISGTLSLRMQNLTSASAKPTPLYKLFKQTSTY